eukprot:10332364-Alexandrium_andersonii.AAC.1
MAGLRSLPWAAPNRTTARLSPTTVALRCVAWRRRWLRTSLTAVAAPQASATGACGSAGRATRADATCRRGPSCVGA